MESKGMSATTIIIGLVVIGLIAYGIMSYTSSDSMMKKNDAMMMKGEDSMMQKDGMMQDDKMMQDGAMMEKSSDSMMQKDTMAMKDTEMMKKDDSMMVKAGSYVAYDASQVTLAAQNGKAVLFFHAAWCPTCRAADAELLKMTSSIPTGTTIFKTDYDSSTDLKKKYGVTTQHTFVQVDAQGNMITSWRGSTTVADIVAKIK